jgi:N-glycosylase/DNA lyase
MRVMMTSQRTSEVSRIRRCESGHTFSTREFFDAPMPKDKRKHNTTRKIKVAKPQKIDLTVKHVAGIPTEKRLTVLEMLT